MTNDETIKLVEIIEDAICNRVDIDKYEEILPKVSKILFERYCKTSQTKHIDHKQTTHN